MDVPPASDTTAEAPDLDAGVLAGWLAQRLEGFRGPLGFRRFEGGQSNPTYLLQAGERRWVLRSKPGPAARLLPSAHAIEREFAVMQALADSEVPVPRMLLLCEDESVIGHAFYVMEHVQGRVFWDQSLPGLAGAQRAALYDEMNRVIPALHRVDFASRGLSGYGRPGNYFERQIGRWTRQYRASSGPDGAAPIEAMERLIDWLPAHLPAGARDDSQPAVVHGDYRLDNLVFHPEEPRIVAVLDWELSTLGHPLADFSYHCMSWRIAPGVFRGLGGLDLPALGIPAERDYIARYCRRTGRLSEALEADWGFYLAYNLFRMAGILQGIARRVIDGTAVSARAREAAAAAGPLAELGWSIARQG